MPKLITAWGVRGTSGSENVVCREGSHFRGRARTCGTPGWEVGSGGGLGADSMPRTSPFPLLQRGTYLPQTYIIQEEMVVTEHVSDKEALGSFIYHLCNGKDTYRLRRRATRRRE